MFLAVLIVGLSLVLASVGLLVRRAAFARSAATASLIPPAVLAVALIPYACTASMYGTDVFLAFLLPPIGLAAGLSLGGVGFVLVERRWRELTAAAAVAAVVGLAAAFVTFRLLYDKPFTPYMHHRAGGGFFGSYDQAPAHVRYLLAALLPVIGFSAARAVSRPFRVTGLAALAGSLALATFLFWQVGMIR